MRCISNGGRDERVPNSGDSRSLIVDPTHVTHREVPQRYYEAAGVGDDLIADLDQAIAGAYAA